MFFFCSLSSFFYPNRCFKDAWKRHSQGHTCLKFPSATCKLNEPLSPLTPVYEEVSSSNNGNNKDSNGTANCPPQEGWVTIGQDKVYTPSSSDVGSRLRIEVRAVALADGEVLAGPIATFTETVLQAPGPPPKRVSLPASQSH